MALSIEDRNAKLDQLQQAIRGYVHDQEERLLAEREFLESTLNGSLGGALVKDIEQRNQLALIRAETLLGIGGE